MQAVGATVVCCIALASGAAGQSGQQAGISIPYFDTGTLTPTQESAAKAGKMPQGLTEEQAVAVQLVYNLHELTPGQQARAKQLQQLRDDGMKAFKAGRYGEAIADARQAIAMNEADPLAPKIVAQALEAQGKIPEALAAYQALADRGSSHPEDLMPYALLLLHQGQWGAALAAFEKALPFVSEGVLLRANSGFSFDAPQPATLEAAIHVARGLTYNTGDIVTPHPQNERALIEDQKALALAPESPLTNFYYGFTLKLLGRRSEAQAAFATAAQLGGEDVKAAVKRFSR